MIFFVSPETVSTMFFSAGMPVCPFAFTAEVRMPCMYWSCEAIALRGVSVAAAVTSPENRSSRGVPSLLVIASSDGDVPSTDGPAHAVIARPRETTEPNEATTEERVRDRILPRSARCGLNTHMQHRWEISRKPVNTRAALSPHSANRRSMS